MSVLSVVASVFLRESAKSVACAFTKKLMRKGNCALTIISPYDRIDEPVYTIYQGTPVRVIPDPGKEELACIVSQFVDRCGRIKKYGMGSAGIGYKQALCMFAEQLKELEASPNIPQRGAITQFTDVIEKAILDNENLEEVANMFLEQLRCA